MEAKRQKGAKKAKKQEYQVFSLFCPCPFLSFWLPLSFPPEKPIEKRVLTRTQRAPEN
jgi:hypothetical protein